MILCENCSPRLSCSVYRNGDTRTECEFYQPLTEQEWLRSATTEQLAEWIFQIFGEGVAFGETHGKTNLFPNDDIIHEGLVLEWLKQPHTEGDSE